MEDGFDVRHGQREFFRHGGERNFSCFREKAQIERIEGNRKEEFFLGLRQGKCIGGRWPGEDFLRHLQESAKLDDLRFIQVRDRFEIRGTVAVFHEKALIEFESIGSASHRIVKAIGMMVLHHFADSLFEVGSGHDLLIGFERQPFIDSRAG